MDNFWNYVESAFTNVRGKPFSYLQRVLLYTVIVTTAINIFHCGFLWTLVFVVTFLFLGCATFLLLIDDTNGGIASETRKLLQLVDTPLLTKLLEQFPDLRSAKPSEEKVVQEDDVADRLTSVSLEKIYPWLTLQVPKVLDHSLTKLFEIIVSQYALRDWYSLVQVRRNFSTEIRYGLRFAASRVARKLSRADFASLIHEKAFQAFVDHVSVFLQLRARAKSSQDFDVGHLMKTHRELSHPALASEKDEDAFCFNLSRKLLALVLPREYRRFPAANAVLREVFTETVLKVVVESLSEPYRINYLLAVGLSSVGSHPDVVPVPEVDLTPVPLLKDLVVEEKPLSTIQKVPFRQILKETTLKNSFEQYLKSLGLEDFYRVHESMEWINKFLDSAVLGEAALKTTYGSIVKLKKELDVAATKGYTFPSAFVRDVDEVVKGGVSAVPRLRQIPAWKNTYSELLGLIEHTLVPGFQETRLYHHLLIPPTEEVRKRIRRGQSRRPPGSPASFQQLSESVRGALRDAPPIAERQESEMYDDFDGSSPYPEDEEYDDLDSEPVNEDMLGSTLRDLSCFDITVNRAERRRDDRGRIYMVLNVIVLDRGPLSPDNGKMWSVQRKYSEFYILESKIKEFHGLLHASSFLAPKRAWSTPTLEYLQTQTGNFERFLQSLVRERKLQYSQMLFNFLATTVEFDAIGGFPDLGLSRVMKTVPQILTTERGQNVESFIRSLLAAALPGKTKNPNEVSPSPSEISVPIETALPSERLEDITFDVPDFVAPKSPDNFAGIHTIFDGIMYLSSSLLKANPEMLSVLACCRSFAQPVVEDAVRGYVKKIVDYFEDPRQLSFLVDLLCDALTGVHPPVDEVEKERSASATWDLMRMLMDNPVVESVCGEKSEKVARLMFDLFQYKVLNKRLILILLDLIVEEVFPEIGSAAACYVDEM